MCGRMELVVSSRKKLTDFYSPFVHSASQIEGHVDVGILAHYNIPPTAITPLITTEAPEEIVLGHWGYKPAWATDSKSKVREVINARAETVLEKPFFKSSIETRRCLIPVTGFFEWKRAGSKKTPYRFHMDGELFSLAGVYANLVDKKGLELPHYAIITTTASKLMAPIHDRMPVIIPTSHHQDWISDSLSDSDIDNLMKPFRGKMLKKYEISPLVNSVRNNSPTILDPV